MTYVDSRADIAAEDAERNGLPVGMDADQSGRGRPWEPASEEHRTILKARARDMARELDEDASVGETVEIVEFTLAHEVYGVESAYSREVYSVDQLTPLPCTPAFIVGILNVRGQILAVMDLKVFFELPAAELTERSKVIVVGNASIDVGLLADTVVGIRSLAVETIQPPLPTLTDVRSAYLRGVTEAREVILDVGRLLSDERIVVHEETST